MAGVIENIDKRTRLAGYNRLEILMFHLGNDKQLYGINVFKVQEVIICPKIRKIPGSMPVVSGIIDIRGKTIPVIEMAMAIGKTSEKMVEPGFLIVSEYNKHVQAFRVSSVDRIVNMTWEEIKEPPKGLGKDCYLTSIAQIDDQFLEIIDVEKIFSELKMVSVDISEETVKCADEIALDGKFVLIVDDSSVARKQISIPLKQLGIENVMKKNGKEALDYLNDLADNDPQRLSRLGLIVSDVEMPLMDGYTLVSKIRETEGLKGLYIILHSSLSGIFNKSLVEKVGANEFIAKYEADTLTQAVLKRLK